MLICRVKLTSAGIQLHMNERRTDKTRSFPGHITYHVLKCLNCLFIGYHGLGKYNFLNTTNKISDVNS